MTSKYPFDDWLDGRVWMLRYQAEFVCMPLSMQSMLYGEARRRGLSVSTRLVFEGDREGVMVQAYGWDSTWKPNLLNISWTTIKKAMDNKR